MRLWVAVLESTPTSLLFPLKFNGACKQLLDAGFEGDKVFLAGHGLGGRLKLWHDVFISF